MKCSSMRYIFTLWRADLTSQNPGKAVVTPDFRNTASSASASAGVGVFLDIHHRCGLNTCFLPWRKRAVIRSSMINHFDSCQEVLLLQSDLHIRMDLVTIAPRRPSHADRPHCENELSKPPTTTNFIFIYYGHYNN